MVNGIPLYLTPKMQQILAHMSCNRNRCTFHDQPVYVSKRFYGDMNRLVLYTDWITKKSEIRPSDGQPVTVYKLTFFGGVIANAFKLVQGVNQ